MKVFAMITNGTEEVECLAVVDILRRAGIDTVLVGVGGKTVVSSHGVTVTADVEIDDVDFLDADVIFVPGGMPGTKNLAACGKLIDALKIQDKANKRIAAVCAAPSLVLGANGFLKGKKAICFPGMEDNMLDATVVTGARVVTDGNITTARGLGCSIELGLELVRLLLGEDKAAEIKGKIQF